MYVNRPLHLSFISLSSFRHDVYITSSTVSPRGTIKYVIIISSYLFYSVIHPLVLLYPCITDHYFNPSSLLLDISHSLRSYITTFCSSHISWNPVCKLCSAHSNQFLPPTVWQKETQTLAELWVGVGSISGNDLAGTCLTVGTSTVAEMPNKSRLRSDSESINRVAFSRKQRMGM